jgi:uncharacterized protein
MADQAQTRKEQSRPFPAFRAFFLGRSGLFCVLFFTSAACQPIVSGASMKIPFAEIAQNGSRYCFSDNAWLHAAGLTAAGPAEAHVTLRRKGDSRAEAQGTLCAALRLTCDRCLSEYDFSVAAEFHLLLEAPEDEDGWSCKEMDNSAELELMEVAEPVADLMEMLRQQLVLSLPVKQLCSPNCQGLCSECGADLNSGSCTCAAETENSPFAALAAWKKNK